MPVRENVSDMRMSNPGEQVDRLSKTARYLAHSPDLAAAEEAARRRIAEAREKASREMGWRGCVALFRRETQRFMKMAGQTLLSPCLTTMLWFVVFGFTLGSRVDEVGGIRYIDFLVPGLIMLNLINSAYLNAAFSLFLLRLHGSIVDLLVSPLTPRQIVIGYACSSALRAVMVGMVIWIVATFMGAGTLYNPFFTVVFMALTSLAFGLLGLVVAIVAKDFDHVNFLPSFLLMPLMFLGGVFYSVEMLPAFWARVSLANPILYMVNGLRYGMTGVTDVPIWVGLIMIFALVIVSGWLAAYLLVTGRKLREGA